MNNFDRLDEQIWNLDAEFARYIYPRLLYFKIHSNSIQYPPQEYYEIGEDYRITEVDDYEYDYDFAEMIWAFKTIAEECYLLDKELEARIDRGLSTFRRLFRGLWL